VADRPIRVQPRSGDYEDDELPPVDGALLAGTAALLPDESDEEPPDESDEELPDELLVVESEPDEPEDDDPADSEDDEPEEPDPDPDPDDPDPPLPLPDPARLSVR